MAEVKFCDKYKMRLRCDLRAAGEIAAHLRQHPIPHPSGDGRVSHEVSEIPAEFGTDRIILVEFPRSAPVEPDDETCDILAESLVALLDRGLPERFRREAIRDLMRRHLRIASGEVGTDGRELRPSEVRKED